MAEDMIKNASVMIKGHDGFLSIRRVMSAWFIVNFTILCWYGVLTNVKIQEEVIISTVMLILVPLGLTTWQNKIFANEKKDNYIEGQLNN